MCAGIDFAGRCFKLKIVDHSMSDLLDPSSPNDDDPANKDIPKRCERCKRAKKGAQYCFDSGHHNGSVPLFPVIEPPPPTKPKGKRSSGAGAGGTPPAKKKHGEGKGAAAKEPAQTSEAHNAEDGDGAEGDGDDAPAKEEKEKTTKFDTNRRARKWERRLMPVKLIGGEEILMYSLRLIKCFQHSSQCCRSILFRLRRVAGGGRWKWVTSQARMLASNQDFTSAEAQVPISQALMEKQCGRS